MKILLIKQSQRDWSARFVDDPSLDDGEPAEFDDGSPILATSLTDIIVLCINEFGAEHGDLFRRRTKQNRFGLNYVKIPRHMFKKEVVPDAS